MSKEQRTNTVSYAEYNCSWKYQAQTALDGVCRVRLKLLCQTNANGVNGEITRWTILP
jgi:hypothetical protein